MHPLTRRRFLTHGSAAVLTAAATDRHTAAAALADAARRPSHGAADSDAAAGPSDDAPGQGPGPGVRIGLVADAHYADTEPRGTRVHRDSLGKMRGAVECFGRERIDLAVELGDFVDQATPPDRERELGFLRAIEAVFAGIGAPRHHVLGNHCVAAWSKQVFLDAVGQERAHYAFDARGVRIIILDACYRADGQPYGAGNFEWTDADVPPFERAWLAAELSASRLPAVVFVHQRLDLPVGDDYAIASAPEVRAILESSGRVRAVVMGHSHRNDAREINGIPYLTLAALVEGTGTDNGAHAILTVGPGGALSLAGYGRLGDHPFAATPRRAR